MTIEEIFLIMANRGYPDILTEDQIIQAAQDALDELRTLVPVSKSGFFNTVVDQTVYDIFSRNNTSPPVELVDSLGFRVQELIWSPIGFTYDANTDVYSFVPFLQYFNIYGTTSLNFETPSDYTVFQDDLMLWRKRYSAGGFLPVTSNKGSAIQLLPMPKIITPVWVFYTAENDDPNLADTYRIAYLYLVEAHLNQIIGRSFAIQAGLQMGAFKDLGKSGQTWKDGADHARDLAMQSLTADTGIGLIGVGTRS